MNESQCAVCNGTQAEGGFCIGHLTPELAERYARRIRAGAALDGSNAAISADALDRLRRSFDAAGVRAVQGAKFEGTAFSGEAVFLGLKFSSDASFAGAKFSGDANFSRTEFSGDVDFRGVQFAGLARFRNAQFLKGVDFERVEFSNGAEFLAAVFSLDSRFTQAKFSGSADFSQSSFRRAVFDSVSFTDDVWFLGTKFERDASFIGIAASGVVSFGGARFTGRSNFRSSRFGGRVNLRDAVLATTADFENTVFDRPAMLGPFVGRRLIFQDAVFKEGARVDVAAASVDCRRTRFQGNLELNLRWAEVDMTGAIFERRSRLAGAAPFVGIDEGPAQVQLEAGRAAQPQPRLSSLQQVDVQKLALSNVDLRSCRFLGAHSLDEIRIEPTCRFASPPASRRFTRRLTLAEEHAWRASRVSPSLGLGAKGQSDGWYPPECHDAEPRHAPQPVPVEIAGIYRSLRKALEDRGDMPGAGDFYYGEMEMRRLAYWSEQADGQRVGGLGETLILTLYWLSAGYGLRGSRAFAFFVASILTGGALLFLLHLFEKDQSAWRSLFFSFESAISFLRPPKLELKPAGEVIQSILRILGPLFFGLGLLALRGRVKR